MGRREITCKCDNQPAVQHDDPLCPWHPDHATLCCRACGTHASPHVGCILR